MKVRAEALARALHMLPAATPDGPPVIVMPIAEFRESVLTPRFTGTELTTPFQRLVFKRERYAEGRERWYEWTLDVNT